ncbi:D-inositol 3-phosphate glycosyltransferase [Vibrio ruber DSM 16370]|uniref:D-inositol 3-phosphate glycosyltransferase n=1 Tax=Vibrio ruber (strain DSM 16370 / JCM 11486 / BCRC 17186 / CECT 7878 / LMG 23124 / VR1) TaxID=1123498 RepID=A0A1R4LLP5_VIBR1|nr:glycosyltransferase family 1 protein [Vibrio ruber]SJN57349.1 D-inositol 3-phosphate glycosyltransferase [Vibrio ruber DSM 16370]
MNIYVNSRVLSGPFSGVSRYLKNILSELDENHPYITCDSDCRGVKGHLWEQLLLPKSLDTGSLLWSPSNTGPLYIKSRHVVTIHDLAPLDNPEWTSFKFRTYYLYLLPRLLKKVNHIITISEFTKSRIIEYVDIDESKISVIPNGVDKNNHFSYDSNCCESIKLNMGISDKRYVLSVSSIEPRKNIKGILHAWSKIVDLIDDDIWLVLVGKTNPHIFSDVGVKNIPKRVKFVGFVEDQWLPFMYKFSEAFIYVPFYEGFGLPPLEAMSHGSPVITSNCTSLPEVVGNSALLVNPYCVDEIAQGLKSILSDSRLRNEYVRKGYEQSEKFSWKSTAEKTYSVLMNHT